VLTESSLVAEFETYTDRCCPWHTRRC